MLAMSTTPNPIFLFILSITTIIIIPSPSFSLHFNLTAIGPNQSGRINLTGNATLSTRGLDVTPPDDRRPAYQTGRATYSDPLHLWDRASGNLTSFSTRFSFSIDSNGSTDYGDGLAFFLAPIGSTIPPLSYGGNLGLGNGGPFVAVEFDTFENDFDPARMGPHVGIDVSSMASVNATAWLNDIPRDSRNEAWISFAASSMTLTVDFTNSWQKATSIGSLSRQVDLREVLPEYVSFGFSAGTAVYIEKHIVESWEFSSRFDLNASVSEERPRNRPRGNESRTPMIVGPSVGLVVLVLVVALGILYWLKCKKGTRDEEEEVQEVDPLTMDMEFEKGSGAKRFPYGELVRATNNFAEEEKLGEGGFGCVYRGFLAETDSYMSWSGWWWSGCGAYIRAAITGRPSDRRFTSSISKRPCLS